MALTVGRGLTVLSDEEGFHSLSDSERIRLQELLHEISLDIAAFCEVYGLTVMLSGGSCLGAVRHKGFIPWDDDMDLNMPRADYDVFCEEFPRLFKDKYSVRIPGKTPGCASRTLQVRLKGTIVRDFNDIDAPVPGAFVDVFPIENVPNNAILRYMQGLASMGSMYLQSCRRYYQFRDKFREISNHASESTKKAIETKIKIGRLFASLSCERLARLMDAVNGAYKNPQSQCVTIPTGSKRYFGEMCPREVHLPQSEGVFEGVRWALPGKPDDYLSMLYGDYMTVPAENEREHHYFLEFDLGMFAGEKTDQVTQ